MLRFLLPLVATTACTFGSPKVWVEDSATMSIAVGPARELRVATHNGGITANAADGQATVEVRYRRRGGGADESDAQRCLEAIAVRGAVVDQAVVVDWSWAVPRESGWGGEVEFEIDQPASLPVTARVHNGTIVLTTPARCDAETHNGGIEIRGTTEPVRATTHNGSIAVRASSPSVELTTHNGGVSAAFDRSGPVDGSVTTHNGTVELAFASGVSTELHCQSVNGRITTSGLVDASFVGENGLHAVLGQGGSKLEVGTHNGRIEIRRE